MPNYELKILRSTVTPRRVVETATIIVEAVSAAEARTMLDDRDAANTIELVVEDWDEVASGDGPGEPAVSYSLDGEPTLAADQASLADIVNNEAYTAAP